MGGTATAVPVPEVKERGILFSAPMVLALLAGEKTQTRRILKPQPAPSAIDPDVVVDWRGGQFSPKGYPSTSTLLDHCPYGKPGDRLWVRETWQAWADYDGTKPADIPEGAKILYTADRPGMLWDSRVRPSIFMPRWASRITLEITEVRVERLQAISEADVIAEGIRWYEMPGQWGYGWSPQSPFFPTAVESYVYLINSINGPDTWDLNPWVWVVSFRLLEQPR